MPDMSLFVWVKSSCVFRCVLASLWPDLSVRWSVGLLVCWSIGPSVRRSVRPLFGRLVMLLSKTREINIFRGSRLGSLDASWVSQEEYHRIRSSYNHFIVMTTHCWPYGPCSTWVASFCLTWVFRLSSIFTKWHLLAQVALFAWV